MLISPEGSEEEPYCATGRTKEEKQTGDRPSTTMRSLSDKACSFSLTIASAFSWRSARVGQRH